MEYQELKVAVADGSENYPVGCLAFDGYEELLWVANQGGHATAYYGPDLEKYSSFQACNEGITQIFPSEEGGLVVLCNSGIRGIEKQGIPKFALNSTEHNDLENLRCGLMMSGGKSFLLGGEKSLLDFDVIKAEATKKVSLDEPVVILRKGPRHVCCGQTSGKVSLRDSRTLNVEHVLEAHGDGLSDFDISGNLLVTCGYSSRYGQISTERQLMVHDIRTMKPMPPVQLPVEPFLLKFVPAYTSRLVVMSQTGLLLQCDPSVPHSAIAATRSQVLAEGTFCFGMDVSSTGQALAIVDSEGVIHLCSSNHQPLFNFHSKETPFPDPIPTLPYMDFDDVSMPLSMIPMGFPSNGTALLSDWPESVSRPVLRPAPKIDPEILQNMKVVDGIGRAPNPGKKRRNQVPYDLNTTNFVRKGPKAKDERQQENEAIECGIPREYWRMEMKYTKFGLEDSDMGEFNRTPFAGLDSHTYNTYCNAMIQLLYFLEPLRVGLQNHVCVQESCLACQLGFLFKMLDVATKGKTCRAVNFLRVFQTLPQALALGLVLSEKDETGDKSNLIRLLQSWSRFLLQHVSQDLDAKEKSESGTLIQRLFGTEMNIRTHCMCGKETTRGSNMMHVTVNYPKRRPPDGEDEKMSFAQLLQRSICREQVTQAWCDQCGKYKPHTQSRQITRLPDVILISCMEDVKDFEFWQLQQKLAVEAGSGHWLPHEIQITLNESGGDVVVENCSQAEDVHLPAVEYSLVSKVSYVQNHRKGGHLVAHVRVGSSYHARKLGQPSSKDAWYLFNDFTVILVDKDESVKFFSWQIPCHLCYAVADVNQRYESEIALALDSSYLQPSVINAAPFYSMTSVRPIQPDEFPSIVAMDSEFVTLRQQESELHIDGTEAMVKPSQMSPARITVIRGDPPHEGEPFIDDYIKHSELVVVDYVTKYSGIQPGDLDPMTSKKQLTTMKKCYLKLRCLFDRGVRVVGHGLQKDLAVINIDVAPEQILDTVELFHLPGQRYLSLRFMAWYFLGLHIQRKEHDSVEDAKTALKLYRKYEQLQSNDSVDFNAALERLYKAGRQHNWTVPA